MESTLKKEKWGWEYTSQNGNKYSIGEITAEFNVVADSFDDINDMFDYEAIVLSHPIDYVYGDLERDTKEIKEWLDYRIEKYEKHERIVKFYTNLTVRSDKNVCYECYIGTEEKKRSNTRKIERSRLLRIANEVRGGR